MGAWGSGSFENDAALDWAGGIRSLSDLREPIDRLQAVGSGHVDADLACEVIAAAEAVAMLMGRKSADFPEDLQEQLATAGEPDKQLYHQVRSAVMQVMRNSELADLWEESAAETGNNEWLASLTGLIERLNPDVEAAPWSDEEIEKVAGPMQTCAFCDQPIDQSDLFMMTFYDASNRLSGGRGMWMHLRCLNSRLHHRHAVINLKFDPSAMAE
ncbi:MAG TPA: DUF4259 domain-containing protein [Sphingomicrobium sp.]|nr:DUF4259 domain-containing protein [Sphingomicrobium sp.]